MQCATRVRGGFSERPRGDAAPRPPVLLAHSAEDAPSVPLVWLAASAGFSAVPAAIRQACLQCAARVRGRFSRTPALENKTDRAEVQLHAHRCCSRIRQKPRHPCRWSGCPPPRDFPPPPLLSAKPACRCRSRIRQKTRHPCCCPARLRRISRRTRCPSISLLAVRRSCPREIQPNAAPENKTDRAAMQLHAHRCCSRIRQKTRRPHR